MTAIILRKSQINNDDEIVNEKQPDDSEDNENNEVTVIAIKVN